MKKHVLDDRIGALAVLHDLLEVALQHIHQFSQLGAGLSHPVSRLPALPDFIDQLGRKRREIIDEIERVLDLVSDAGGELAERGKLFSLHQTILRGPQVFQRFRQLAGARFHVLEQTHVFDGDHRLVGKGSDEFDLLFAERPHVRSH